MTQWGHVVSKPAASVHFEHCVTNYPRAFLLLFLLLLISVFLSWEEVVVKTTWKLMHLKNLGHLSALWCYKDSGSVALQLWNVILFPVCHTQQFQRRLSDRVQRWHKHCAPGNNQQILLLCSFDWLSLLVKVSEERESRRRERESKSESQRRKSPVSKDRDQDALSGRGWGEEQRAEEDIPFVSPNHSNDRSNRQKPEELRVTQRSKTALGKYSFSNVCNSSNGVVDSSG